MIGSSVFDTLTKGFTLKMILPSNTYFLAVDAKAEYIGIKTILVKHNNVDLHFYK